MVGVTFAFLTNDLYFLILIVEQKETVTCRHDLIHSVDILIFKKLVLSISDTV